MLAGKLQTAKTCRRSTSLRLFGGETSVSLLPVALFPRKPLFPMLPIPATIVRANSFRRAIMSFTIEAIYENGVLKPVRALPLHERQKVEITVKAVPSRVRRTAGLLGWTGSQEDADFVATSPELDPQEDE